MAAYISVPRDLANVKTKVAFNLTKRQLICFGAAALVGVPLFFVLRDVGGNTAATLGMMVVMLPAFFLGMYQKNGQPAEKLLRYYVQAKFLRPKVRPYKTCNYYSILTKAVPAEKCSSPYGTAVHPDAADVRGRNLPREKRLLYTDGGISGHQLSAGPAGGPYGDL